MAAYHLSQLPAIVTIDAFVTPTQVPTITSARASCRAYWDTKLQRRLTVNELAALQGCDVDQIDRSIVSDAAFGRMVGNAMSVSVVKRLIRNIIAASGLRQSLTPALGNKPLRVRRPGLAHIRAIDAAASTSGVCRR
jgi:hypothetical protein